MTEKYISGWEFIDKNGTFRLKNPHRTSFLYFPLVNEAGLYSAISPNLHGDIKTDHNSFLTVPVSVENLQDSRSARNFWVYFDDQPPWSVSGRSATQISNQFSEEDEELVLEAGFLWQRITRKNSRNGLVAEVTNFVPASDDRVELMKVTLSNNSGVSLQFVPTAAIPIYGRSADNLRDHRHVTSLLNRIYCDDFGVYVTPTLSFDERGHQPNTLTYAILGAEEDGTTPQGFFPIVEDFIGEGGSQDWPQSIVQNLAPSFKSGMHVDGYEAMGGIQFRQTTLQPGEKRSFVLIMAITRNNDLKSLMRIYGNAALFDEWMVKTRKYWLSKLSVPQIHTGDERFNRWLRWVTLQPILRRYFGNSFLPYHDYGRGGRGWRDLWQDILALLIMENVDVGQSIFDNFGGVRIDGSNATIIGNRLGEFKADRNNIPRVWMDHGLWPLLTTEMYIDQTGDLAFLLRSQVYFKDQLIDLAKHVDLEWSAEQGTQLLSAKGGSQHGTILEHLLVQHLVPFFNVGAHNNIRLEGADWNDAMDMASQSGESVAFTAFYAGNLRKLSDLVLALSKLDIQKVEIASELGLLIESLTNPVDYDSVSGKNTRLSEYFLACMHFLSGEKKLVEIGSLASDLRTKSDWLSNHIRNQEWVSDSAGYGWFNGYYDNNSERVEGEFPKGVRMILTSQVFTLMSGVASDEQANEIIRSVERYLYDQSVGGYRLNTNFGEVMAALGRGFGFAYGHKENGAMFSHMAVMYANALYQRGFVKQGYKVLREIYQYCQDFRRSHIYPGIPEYINQRGRGMYPYLTGSASWYLLTLVNESFGVKGFRGDLVLEPKLVIDQFDREGTASLTTGFANQKLEITYQNLHRQDFGEYQVQAVYLDKEPVAVSKNKVVISRNLISRLNPTMPHHIEVELGDNPYKND